MNYDEHGNFANYDTKNIEDIQIGDLVYSYNTLTGETELTEVTQTFALRSDHINYLTVVDENGDEQVIETTDSHPFWVVTDDPDLERVAREVVDENGAILYHENLEPGLNGFWVEAKDLRVGDVFLGANGELSTLTSNVRVEQTDGISVFNFEVEGNHNYFILAKEYDNGQSCVLVHNAKYSKIKIDSKKHPESAQHLRDSGYNNKLVTVDRVGTAQRRKKTLAGIKTKPGKDRDEMPPAVFKEGSQSVRHISRSDNRGAGASIGNQLRNIPDGTKVRFITDP